MKRFLAAVLCSLVLATPAMAANKPQVLPINSNTVINGTGVQTFGPFWYENLQAANIQGAFALNVACNSATGDADVQIEVLVESAIQGSNTAVPCYSGATSVSLLTSSSFTDFGEGEWFMGVQMCVGEGFYVRYTGVGSNPTDTVCSGQMLYQ